jgi:hypothetical protein
MFFFRKLLVIAFIGLFIFGLLGVYGGRANSGFETAYRQGFADGRQSTASGAEAADAANSTGPSGTNIYYRDHSLFFPGPALLLCLVPLFAFGLLAMKSGRRHRYGRSGAWGPCGPASKHRKRGSWDRWDDNPNEKSPDDIDDGPDETIRYV